MKKLPISALLIGVVCAILLWIYTSYFIKGPDTQKTVELPKPFDKYSFESLKKAHFNPSNITIETNPITQESNFTSHIFYFKVEGRRVSGLMNIPNIQGKHPIIILIRGFVDPTQYTSGTGSKRVGEVLSQNGFITLAPDFFGYGESDTPVVDPLEDRFQTYTTMLTLLKSIDNLNDSLADTTSNVSANTEKVGIWGHSNGGQIALSTLALSGGEYPTVLWNPVSKPFPYSILYFTDEYEDHGKALRKIVANFETDYDIEKYSPTNYYSWINAPIQLHQAADDSDVPLKWSDTLYESLNALKKDIDYLTYDGEDHHFSKGSWDTIVSKNIEFYKSHFLKDLNQ